MNKDYWDGKYVHLSAESGHSTAFQMTCGITLSTFAGPNAKVTYNDRFNPLYVEKSVGYSFEFEPVTCPECLLWMEANLYKCKKGCGRFVGHKDFSCIHCNTVNGRLEAFFETGTEGIYWMLYKDGHKGYDALVSIDEYDLLTVYNEDNTIAFHGVIIRDFEVGKQKFSFGSYQRALGCTVHWIQKGFEPDNWARFFMPEKPAVEGHGLRASLIKMKD